MNYKKFQVDLLRSTRADLNLKFEYIDLFVT